MTTNVNHLEIDESKPKYALDKMKPGSQEWINLWTKNLLTYEAYARFWKPRLEIGKKCLEYKRRKIFTAGQLTKMKDIQGKIPVEPQEIKKVVNSLKDQISKMMQATTVTQEDDSPPENAASPEVIDVVLKWMEYQYKIDRKKKKALGQGLDTGYPQWLWMDKVENSGSEGDYSGKLEASLLPWDGTLCTPYFEEVDGTDIEDIIRLDHKTKYELLKEYPEREKQHKIHEKKLQDDPGYIHELLMTENDQYTADDRPNILFNMLQSGNFESMNGYYLIAERVFCVEKIQEIYINEETGDSVFLSPEWSAAQKQLWKDIQTEHNVVRHEPVRTLWTTTIDTTGFIWENGEHWYQMNGELPGKVFVADMTDREPTGHVEDMLPYVLAIAVSDTEGLHEVRTGTGSLTTVMEGSILHPKYLNKELSRSQGVAIIKKNAVAGMDSVKQTHRTPNETFFMYGDRMRQQLKEVHAINDSVLGATHPRQSDVAKEREINQGLSPQSPYIENYSNFCLDITQMLCNMMPICMNEQQIIEIKDEFGQPVGESVEVNVEEFGVGDESGQAKIVANDLTSCKYRIMAVPGEDTPTSRERQLKEFVGLLEAVGNTLFQINPKLLANILLSWPNRYAKEAGKSLLEFADTSSKQEQQIAQQEQELEKVTEQGRRAVDYAKMITPKVSFKFDPEDIQAAPMGARIMFDYYKKFIAMNQTPPPQPPQQEQQQQAPPQPAEAVV